MHVDFLSSNGLTLYEYRLIEPDPESGDEATLDLQPVADLGFAAELLTPSDPSLSDAEW